MQVSINTQTVVFAMSILLGVLLGIFYDVLRFMRTRTCASVVKVAFFDSIFWIVVALSVFVFIINKAHAQSRIYLLIGMLLGSVLYFITFSPLLFEILDFIVETLMKILSFFSKISKRIICILSKVKKLFKFQK